jgi:hypothetical protein
VLINCPTFHILNVAIHWRNELKLKKQMNKIKLTSIFLLLFSLECFSQQTGNNGITQTAVKNGIGIGSAIAIVVSWDRNKSILYALLHGILGWLYVIYFVIVRESEEKNK